LAPEYAKAATALKALGNEAVLAKIDATAETALGSRFDIKGYPTLKWFVDGEHVDYNGPRDA
jgi:thioredoxin-like negative regulator of GroEL